MIIELIGGVGAGKSRVLRILKEEYGAAVIETDQTARELERKGQAGYRRLTEEFGDRILGADGELDRKKMADLIFTDQDVLERVNEMIHPLVWEEVYRRAEEFRQDGPRDLGPLSLLVVETALPESRERLEDRELSENHERLEDWESSEDRGLLEDRGPSEDHERLKDREFSEDRERPEAREPSEDCGQPKDRKSSEARNQPDVRKKPDDIYDEVWYVYTLEETRIRRLMESRGYTHEKCLAVMGRQPAEERYRALADRIIDNNGDEEDLRRQLAEILAAAGKRKK